MPTQKNRSSFSNLPTGSYTNVVHPPTLWSEWLYTKLSDFFSSDNIKKIAMLSSMLLLYVCMRKIAMCTPFYIIFTSDNPRRIKSSYHVNLTPVHHHCTIIKCSSAIIRIGAWRHIVFPRHHTAWRIHQSAFYYRLQMTPNYLSPLTLSNMKLI